MGLICPHIVRWIIGDDHRFVMPASCLTGAVLLLAADRFLFFKQGEVFASCRQDQLDAAIVAAVYGVKVDILHNEGQVVVVPSRRAG